MTVYGVSFERAGQIHPFTYEEPLVSGQLVVAESDFGLEIGEIVNELPETTETDKKIVRTTNEEDLENERNNREDVLEALELVKAKVLEHGLQMRMLRARYTLDRTKLIFFFAADGRVDFRALVKDLAMTFKTRIELRQIGVRDVAKMIGGIGMCGMQTCCSRFERDFKSITLKYAKVQQLMINPAKISGVCGRLLCCLAYENDAYLDMLKGVPETGDKIIYGETEYTITEVNIFSRTLRLVSKDGKISVIAFNDANSIKVKGEKNCDLKCLKETEMLESEE